MKQLGLAFACAIAVGCGGGGGGSPVTPPPPPSTLAGSYALAAVEIFGVPAPAALPALCTADTGFVVDGVGFVYNNTPTADYIVSGTLAFDATSATLAITTRHHYYPGVFEFGPPPDVSTTVTQTSSYTRSGTRLWLGDPRLFSMTFITDEAGIRLSKVWCGSPVGEHYLAQWTGLDFQRQ